MLKYRNILLALTPLAMALLGCVNTSAIVAVATATVPISAAVQAASAYDAISPAATAYLLTCKVNSTTCADRSAVAPLVKAVRAGNLARNQVVNLALTACGLSMPLPATLPTTCASQTIPATGYNTLVSSYGTVQSILALYAVKPN